MKDNLRANAFCRGGIPTNATILKSMTAPCNDLLTISSAVKVCTPYFSLTPGNMPAYDSGTQLSRFAVLVLLCLREETNTTLT